MTTSTLQPLQYIEPAALGDVAFSSLKQVHMMEHKHRRMPCKARSVPPDHTTENAYFDIPPNAEHGLTLVCSHPECSLSGGRFKFCRVCEIPVAKRNFARRHSHGLLSSGRGYPSGRKQDFTLTDQLERDFEGRPNAKQHKADAGGQSYPYMGNANAPISTFDAPGQKGSYCQEIGDWAANPLPLQIQSQEADMIRSLFLQGKTEAENVDSRDAHASRKRGRDQITSGMDTRTDSNHISPSQTAHGGQSGAAQGDGVTVMHLTPWERDWNNLLYSRPSTTDKKKMHEWMEKILSQSEAFADSDVETSSLHEEDEVLKEAPRTQHPPSSAHVARAESSLSTGVEGALISHSEQQPQAQSFSSNVAPLPLSDEERRVETSKAA